MATILKKIGLSAGIAFALTLSVFAQEGNHVPAEPVQVSHSSRSVSEFKKTVDELLPNHMSLLTKKAVDNRLLRIGVLFRYTGPPGSESNPALWEEVNEGDIEECDGQEHACAVRVKPEFTTGTPGSRTIDPSALDDYDNLMLVISSGAGLVPDPTAAGSEPEKPYVDQSEIYNKDL